MQLTFEDLGTVLPAGSIEFIGNNQVKLNFNVLTNEELTLQDNILESIAKLMQGLAQFTTAINDERATQSKAPIKFTSQDFDGTAESPVMVFTTKIAINTSTFVENLADPTAE